MASCPSGVIGPTSPCTAPNENQTMSGSNETRGMGNSEVIGRDCRMNSSPLGEGPLDILRGAVFLLDLLAGRHQPADLLLGERLPPGGLFRGCFPRPRRPCRASRFPWPPVLMLRISPLSESTTK